METLLISLLGLYLLESFSRNFNNGQNNQQFNADITVKRTNLAGDYTKGKLYVRGAYYCDTLEETVRQYKIKGITAIPYGKYSLTYEYSPKFKKLMPRINNVPNFEGILLHAGNKVGDTDGCILVGISDGAGGLQFGSAQYSANLNAIISNMGNNLTIEII